MREKENSPNEGNEEEEENSKNFPQILWKEEYSEEEIPHSLEEMRKIQEFYSEIMEWRNFHMNGNMGKFLFPPKGMNEEIYEEIHSLILEEGIPFIEYIQEFLHGMGIEFKENINSKEELREDFKLYKNSS